MSARRTAGAKRRASAGAGRPGAYFNRELSWLAFDERVLEEAADASNPLLERVKFAAIVASNLDEYFMVRVARLVHAIEEGDDEPDPSGLSPARQLALVSDRVHALVHQLYRQVNEHLIPALARHGIRIVGPQDLDELGRAAVAAYFRDDVLPVLTPMAVDTARPFPMLSSLSVNLALRLAPAGEGLPERIAVVQVPSVLPRLLRVAGGEGVTFVSLDALIRDGLAALFPGQAIVECAAFRLTRDAELELDDEGGRSYVEAIEEELRQRRKSDVVRLEIEDGASEALASLLAGLAGAPGESMYRVPGLLDLRALWSLVELPGFEELRDPGMRPVPVLEDGPAGRIFDALDGADILVHHPYDSFDAVLALVEQAADDPDVLAIKQTLYRPGGSDSPVIAALMRAARHGKQVTAVVELMARFDEESNLRWARALEEAGAHVIYGVRGLKVHAKCCLVVRRTDQGLRRYVHVATGNYNHRTARVYTDVGLLTSSPAFGQDASAFFNALTGYSDPPRMKTLVLAPSQLRDRILRLIERETRRAGEGQPALIRAKMNALVDERVVEALYRASDAGVRVQLNVRGICVLRPGVAGLSENIQVVSIVGRFLEHARVFHFHNGGEDEVYISSADWMPRNLDRRVELMAPVEAKPCRRRLLHALDVLFQDNVKARRLFPDGTWRVPPRPASAQPFVAQAALYEHARRAWARRQASPAESFAPIDRGPDGHHAQAPGRRAALNT
ncbi:MAG TPA: polyphosphate kinase 1 [Vicinamibacterales bacterium]|nr:polyphosphate kinase 1 [Vicinamibacterales bacterium]